MHVIEVRHAQHRRQHHADQAALFVRVDGVVGRAERPAQRRGGQGGVQGDLGPGRADADVADQRRPQTADHREPGHLDVLPERIGDEIDGVTQRDERLDAVEFAERGAPRLEERLGRNHQDVHWRPQPTEYTGPLCTRSIWQPARVRSVRVTATDTGYRWLSHQPTHRRTGDAGLPKAPRPARGSTT